MGIGFWGRVFIAVLFTSGGKVKGEALGLHHEEEVREGRWK